MKITTIEVFQIGPSAPPAVQLVFVICDGGPEKREGRQIGSDELDFGVASRVAAKRGVIA